MKDLILLQTNKKQSIGVRIRILQVLLFKAYYENNEVMVGIHTVKEPNEPDSSVMFIAKIKDGKVVSHHHLREFDRK